ncbi:FkbM family methyltransferase [Rubrolithibacter danxiaensis]|uniref:FkbM family methyltransferase n=1 Tax=Rubrolithibacter danxiaensis TaxID=3390805 RepID=UPI003BF90A75
MLTSFKRIIKKRVCKWYWNFNECFQYFGEKVYFPKNSIIFKRAIEEGVYERVNLKIIKSIIMPNSTIFDVGANIGLMAIPLLNFDESVKVVSIEASPNTAPYLKKTQFYSSFQHRWTIVDKAVSDRAGSVQFHLTDLANGAYESMQDTKRVSFYKNIEIVCTTIDDIWESLQRPEVSFIKIDIEGADLLALRGGISCIKEFSPAILMEWNSVNIKPFGFRSSDLIDFAKEFEYEIFALPGFSKIDSITDLNLLSKVTENFLLFPKNQNECKREQGKRAF